MNHLLRFIFFVCLIRPFLTFIMGLNIRHSDHIPHKGPAIIVANHNSHLDVPVIISLFPRRLLSHIRPVAAADYFLKNRFMRWFSTEIIGIIPISRGKKRENIATSSNPLGPISDALRCGNVIIFFPEGTRGEPEQMAEFKSGIAVLAHMHPSIPIVPVFLHGLGKSLPRNEGLLVPFFIDVFVGEPLQWNGDKAAFLTQLHDRFLDLANEGHLAEWT